MVNSLVIPGYKGHEQAQQNPKRVIIHGTVSGTFIGGAANNAHYFQQSNAGGLAHWVIDPNTIVNCCPENLACWGDGYNLDEIHIEFADWVDWNSANKDLVGKYKTEANFAKRWSDSDHRAMLHIGASKVAAICDIYHIPTEWLNVAALNKGPRGSQSGVTAHSDISNAWKVSNHQDPGPDFPVGEFMGMVKSYFQARQNSK